jgi:hypothetical protein
VRPKTPPWLIGPLGSRLQSALVTIFLNNFLALVQQKVPGPQHQHLELRRTAHNRPLLSPAPAPGSIIRAHLNYVDWRNSKLVT